MSDKALAPDQEVPDSKDEKNPRFTGGPMNADVSEDDRTKSADALRYAQRRVAETNLPEPREE